MKAKWSCDKATMTTMKTRAAEVADLHKAMLSAWSAGDWEAVEKLNILAVDAATKFSDINLKAIRWCREGVKNEYMR